MLLLDFVKFIAYTWVYLKGYIIVAFLLTKVLTAIYLKFTGYSNWYLGAIPFGHVYFKHELAGVSYVVLAFQVFAELAFCTTYQLVPFIVTVVLCVYTNFRFATIYADQYNAMLYAVVPFGKYYIMVREVISNAGNESR